MTTAKPESQQKTPAGQTGDGARQRALFLLGCTAAYAAMVSLYWQTLDYSPLSLDDQSQLAEAAGVPFSQLWQRDHFGHFRPLKNLFFWLLSRTATISIWRTLVLLTFAATAAAAQALVTRVSASRWLGLGAVVCWVLHPATASVVCWLSTSNVVLALLAMLVYLLLSDFYAVSRLSRGWQVVTRMAAAAALLLGLLSHELLLLSPALLFCLERLRRTGKADWRLYADSVVVFVAYAAASLAAKVGVSPTYRFESETPRWLMSLSAARYFGESASMWLWPFGRFGVLIADEPREHLVASCAWWLGLLFVGYALWTQRRRDPVLTFSLAWIAISLAPLSNFVPLGNTPIAIHYLFIPGIGLATALSRITSLIVARLAPASPKMRALLFATALAPAGGIWFHESSQVVTAWENEEHLYRATLENYPDNVEVLVNLSALYLELGRDAEAAPLLEQARLLSPSDLNVIRNSFALLARAEQPHAALELLQQHPELREQSEFLIREGEILQQLKRFPQARSAFDSAFQRADPKLQSAEWCAAGYGLAVARLQTGSTVEQVRSLVERLSGSCNNAELTQLRDLLR